MPIDASIPLQVKPPQFMTPEQGISLQQLAQQSQMQNMQMQEARRKQQTQVALRDILGKPGAIDEKGMPTDTALGDIGKIDPATMMTMRQQRQKAINEDYALQAQKTGLSVKQNDIFEENLTGHIANYNALTKRLPPEQAKAEFVKGWNDYLDEVAPKGIFNPQQIADWRKIQSPEDALRKVGGSKSYKDMMTVRNQEISQERSAAREQQRDQQLAITERNSDLNAQRTAAALNHIARAGGDKAPSGYRFKKDGTLEPIPGGPASREADSDDRNKTIEKWAKVLEKGGDLPPGLARNKEGVPLVQDIMKRVGTGPVAAEDLLQSKAEYQGNKSAQRTLGTREAQIQLAGNVTAQFAPIAVAASEKFDRTNYKTLNDIQKAVQSRTASPELRQFNFANTSLVNAYARAINPQGVGNQSDKEHAYQVLDTGFSKGDYRAAVEQLQTEINAELRAPGAVKRSMRAFATGKEDEPGAAPAPFSDPDKERRYQEWKAKQK